MHKDGHKCMLMHRLFCRYTAIVWKHSQEVEVGRVDTLLVRHPKRGLWRHSLERDGDLGEGALSLAVRLLPAGAGAGGHSGLRVLRVGCCHHQHEVAVVACGIYANRAVD